MSSLRRRGRVHQMLNNSESITQYFQWAIRTGLFVAYLNLFTFLINWINAFISQMLLYMPLFNSMIPDQSTSLTIKNCLLLFREGQWGRLLASSAVCFFSDTYLIWVCQYRWVIVPISQSVEPPLHYFTASSSPFGYYLNSSSATFVVFGFSVK